MLTSDDLFEKYDSFFEDELIVDDDVCPSCKSSDILTDDGVTICAKCGLQLDIELSEEAEWRYYGAEDGKAKGDPSRCGNVVNHLLPETSLSTIIMGNMFDANKGFRRIHKWSSVSHREKKLINAFNDIDCNVNKESITGSTIDTAKTKYEAINDINIKRGSTRRGIIAACIYQSCYDKKNPKSAKEISKLYNVKLTKITSGCKHYKRMMYFKNKEEARKNSKPCTPEMFIRRYVDQMELGETVYELTVKIYNMVDHLGILLENTPPSIAVGCLYMVLQEMDDPPVDKKRLSSECDISEVTISKTYKKIYPFKPILV